MNYYNEWDAPAAAWLRELIHQGFLPKGLVDERSIEEVTPRDLHGFTQCHFFAGIGGWPLALQLAGIPATTRLWTGSPPCQPFSAAGGQLGQFDPRHLAPVFLNLISQCRPPILFGEQVAPAIAKSWMCDLQTHLEGEGYAVGFAVLPACSVGAPHKRDRLFFGAQQLVNTSGARPCGRALPVIQQSDGMGSLAKPNGEQQRPRRSTGERVNDVPAGWKQNPATTAGFCRDNSTDPHHGFWSDADWLGCRDGKFRPVESGTFPLANGVPARVGRLRGYGNAIVPQVAAEFISAFLEASAEIKG